MHSLLPLSIKELKPTRDYLQNVAKVLGKLQQAFLPAEPHDWHRGLMVNMRGLSTQPFMAAGQATRASIDLVARKVRLNGSKWLLEDYDALEIMKNVRAWLESRGLQIHIEEPEFAEGKPCFDPAQADKYAAALWWMDRQLHLLKAELTVGTASPIWLYPHHFDLSLTWWPHDDERQLAIGWSTGDETIADPYLYLTAYPEPESLTTLEPPVSAFRNHKGFSGVVLLYNELVQAQQPEKLFANFSRLLKQAASLQG